MLHYFQYHSRLLINNGYCRSSLIRRVHGAIVAATGRSDRGDNRQLVARLNRCLWPRRSPVVYTRGDCCGDRRGDDCRDDRRGSRLMYTLQAIVVPTIAPTDAATIAPCIRPITCNEPCRVGLNIAGQYILFSAYTQCLLLLVHKLRPIVTNFVSAPGLCKSSVLYYILCFGASSEHHFVVFQNNYKTRSSATAEKQRVSCVCLKACPHFRNRRLCFRFGRFCFRFV